MSQVEDLVDTALASLAKRRLHAEWDGVASLQLHLDEHLSLTLGLQNLAAELAQTERGRWPWRINRWVTDLVRVLDENPDRGTVAADSCLIKLRPVDDLPFVPDYDASCVIPDMYALAAIDKPDAVEEILFVDRFGSVAWTDLRHRALDNLAALDAPHHSEARAEPDRADSTVHMLTTKDYFGASRVLILDRLLRTHLGLEQLSHGCLVALPNRDVLAVHILEGAGYRAAISLLAAITDGEYARAGGLTQHMYYLPPDGSRGEHFVLANHALLAGDQLRAVLGRLDHTR